MKRMLLLWAALICLLLSPFQVLAEVVDGHMDLVGGEAFAGDNLVGAEPVRKIQQKAPFALYAQ